MIEIIERVVTSPVERKRLEGLLATAMPTAMRRAWDQRQSRRGLEEAMKKLDGRSDPFGDPLASPKQRRENLAFQRELDQIRDMLTLPPDDPAAPRQTASRDQGPPAATGTQNGPAGCASSRPIEAPSPTLAAASPPGFVRPPRQKSRGNVRPTVEMLRQSQVPPTPSEAKPLE